MYYTGVGARKTPQDKLTLMYNIAVKMALLGYRLRSGHADGADEAFERGAGPDKEIYYADNYIPYGKTNRVLYAPDVFQQAQNLSGSFHPAWHKCKPFVRKLHGRNAFQILGIHLQEPSTYCICWTPDGATTHAERCYRTGGTGTAISIADAYKVPVVNLAIPSHEACWQRWLVT